VGEAKLLLLVKAKLLSIGKEPEYSISGVFFANPNRKADLLVVVDPWLHHDNFCPIVCQPAIMHQCAKPDLDAMRSSKLILSNQTMNSAIVVARIARDVFPQVVLFDPVNLKVPKWFAIPAANCGEAVLAP